MKPHYTDDTVTLYAGDCLDVLRELPDASVDSVVTDPPYGLGFMGREWDSIKQDESRPPSADETDARFNFKYPRTGKGPAAVAFDGCAFQTWCEQWATECLRVLKPGGHILAFGGSRTWHRLACAVEDAGFEIRDSIAWLYGSGFPKSLDVSKAIDKAAGVEFSERPAEGVGFMRPDGRNGYNVTKNRLDREGDSTADAQKWAGWGTALKPAFEPIVVGRKPLTGTVAANVLTHGTGALNIAACRVTASTSQGAAGSNPADNTSCTCPTREDAQTTHTPNTQRPVSSDDAHGDRNDPLASVRLDGSERPPLLDSLDGYQSLPRSGDAPAHVALADDLASAPQSPDAHTSRARCATCGYNRSTPTTSYPDSTTPNVETDAGRWPTNVVLDDSQAAELDQQSGATSSRSGGMSTTGENNAWQESKGRHTPGREVPRTGHDDSGGASRFFPTFHYEAKAPQHERPREGATAHPTVKPLDLMRWLVRLVTPPGGTVLDPFAGSGTTAEACVIEHFRCITIEREPDYLPLIVARLTKPIQVGLNFDQS